MKLNKKIIAALLAAVMLLSCIGGASVFAEDDAIDYEDIDNEVIDEADTAVVSGCDLSADKLNKVTVKQYGFSMLVPEGQTITLDSDASVFGASGFTRTRFMEEGCILYSLTDSQNTCSVMVFVSEKDSIFNYYGDYSKLSEEKRKELVADVASENNKAEFVTINGCSFLQITASDNSNGTDYTQYQFTTVINQTEYVILISTLNANAKDKAVLNQIIGSIRVRGPWLHLTGEDTLLLIVSVLLLIAVCVLYFFFYRAQQFIKLGVTDFKPWGFNLPTLNEFDSEDILDNEEDDEDDEEEEDEDEENDDEDDSDEDLDESDERIIKD